jgi:putative ABC transport system substrate-binding protein
MLEDINFQNKTQMSRILLLGIILIGLLLSGCNSKPKAYRVGILSGSDVFSSIGDGFKGKMTELGYVEGKNIVYDFQKLNADPVGFDRVTKSFVADKVDLIFVFPTEPAVAAKTATQGTNIPVVFAHAGLEGTSLVKSVRETGGNLTGTRFPGPDLIVKRFEFLLALKSDVKQLYIPYDKNYPNCAPALNALRPVARSNGVTLVELPITSVKELQADLLARNKSTDIGIDAILLLPELLMQSPEGWATISTFAKEHKLPLVGSSDKTIQTGGVLTYNVNPLESGGIAATIADKILKGTPAGTIPVVTPEAYLRLNYKLARELGLKMSEGLLSQANEIIR